MMEDNNSFLVSEELHGPVLAVFVGLEMIVAVFINSCVLMCTLAQPSSLKKPSTIFLTLLIISNLIIVIFFMPFTVISAATGEWIFGRTDQQKQALCEFVGYMFGLSVGFSTHTLALISVDRCIFIVRPLLYIKYMKVKTALLILTCLIPVLALLNSTTFFGLGTIRFSESVSSCLPLWADNMNYVLFFSLLSIIPYTTIAITSVWTFVHTRNYFKRRQKSDKNTQKFYRGHDPQHEHVYSRKIHNLIGLFGSLLIVHLISLVPYITVSIIGFIIGYDNVPDYVYASVFVLYLLHTITNTIVQAYFRQEIRKVIIAIGKKLVCSLCGIVSSHDTSDEMPSNMSAKTNNTTI